MRALVTGASEGIGRAFAQRLAKEGYQVTVVARSEDRLRSLVKELAGLGHQYLVADLIQPSDLKKVSDEIKSQNFDLLINNAGFGMNGEFYKSDISKNTDMLRLNCEAVMTLSHSFLHSGKAGDALINVSSVLAFMPMPSNPVYAATKSFVTSFTDSLWFESKNREIYVASLCPGMTRTEFQKRSGRGEEHYPSAMTQTPEQVVEYTMKALKKRRSPVIIPGGKNSMLTIIPRFLSRKTVVGIVGRTR